MQSCRTRSGAETGCLFFASRRRGANRDPNDRELAGGQPESASLPATRMAMSTWSAVRSGRRSLRRRSTLTPGLACMKSPMARVR